MELVFIVIFCLIVVFFCLFVDIEYNEISFIIILNYKFIRIFNYYFVYIVFESKVVEKLKVLVIFYLICINKLKCSTWDKI